MSLQPPTTPPTTHTDTKDPDGAMMDTSLNFDSTADLLQRGEGGGVRPEDAAASSSGSFKFLVPYRGNARFLKHLICTL